MSKKKYVGSFAPIKAGKSSTFGFKQKKFKTMEQFADQALRQSWIPVTTSDGHRLYDKVKKIHGWLRFDCDVKGEKETITSILEGKGLSFMALPSTNYDPHSKNYKWHISVPVTKQSDDVMKYKWQMKQALIDLGINLHDRRITEVCVQNFNPYRNGEKPKEGMQYVEFNEGTSLKLKKAPKYVQYSELTKVKFNGLGVNDVIPKKVVEVKGSLEVLSPNSGIRVENVGWVQLKDLNLDVGGIIGGLSCPAHNTRHNNGKGAYQVGYAFATMDEGGDVWVQCTGAECQGKHYKVDYADFGASTKLSDLYSLRQKVSLSAYNYDKASIYNVKDDGSYVMFRWKEVFDNWSRDLFWKLPTGLTDDNVKAMKKLEKKMTKAKKRGDVGRVRDHEKSIEDLSLKNEYDIIEKAMGNEKAFEYFKKKYPPVIKSGVITKMPRDVYIDKLADTLERHIRITKQFMNVEYKIDPFIKAVVGEVVNNTFVITINNLMKNRVSLNPKLSIVEDYKEHNPYLDDLLDMVVAQQFGADKKASYLWMRADSNWGKSYLFDYLIGAYGYSINENETKNAIKGGASGLDPILLLKSNFLFFDEFKGAVSELKNITHTISVTPKFRGKLVVPVGMKFFASAEHISSLHGANGMDEQWRNRFLFLDVKGNLLGRSLFTKDRNTYGKHLMAYINHYLWEAENNYLVLGKDLANTKANERYDLLVDKYTIKANSVSIEDSLPEMFDDWVKVVRGNVWSKGLVEDASYRDVISFESKHGEMYVTNMARLKDVYIEEYIAKEEQASVRHKTMKVIMGSDYKRTTCEVKGQRKHIYKLC